MTRLLMLLSLFSCDMEVHKESDTVSVNVQKVVNYGNRGLQRSFESAVKIEVLVGGEPYGTGSGNYFTYHGNKFIITAAHVVDEGEVVTAKERFGVDSVECKVAYRNDFYDIAVLIPQKEFRTQKPIRYSYYYNMKRGEPVYFTGYPSELEEISSYGYVSGQYAEFFVVQSVAWLGSSGSVVFNSKGKVVGVVSGVKVGMGPMGLPQIINNVVMITPIYFLKDDFLREILNDNKI